jgi:hypothetical protein
VPVAVAFESPVSPEVAVPFAVALALPVSPDSVLEWTSPDSDSALALASPKGEIAIATAGAALPDWVLELAFEFPEVALA